MSSVRAFQDSKEDGERRTRLLFRLKLSVIYNTFLGINAGSVWGITGGRWRLGARAAVATIMSSIGGGATSIVISFYKTKKLQVNLLINGILSSIVSITGLLSFYRPSSTMTEI